MFKEMKTQTHLNPGQKGTKQLVEQFGNALICVRCGGRRDPTKKLWRVVYGAIRGTELEARILPD